MACQVGRRRQNSMKKCSKVFVLSPTIYLLWDNSVCSVLVLFLMFNRNCGCNNHKKLLKEKSYKVTWMCFNSVQLYTTWGVLHETKYVNLSSKKKPYNTTDLAIKKRYLKGWTTAYESLVPSGSKWSVGTVRNWNCRSAAGLKAVSTRCCFKCLFFQHKAAVINHFQGQGDGDGDEVDDDDDDDDDDDEVHDNDDDLQWTEMGPSWPNCSLVLCTWSHCH